MFTRTMYMGPHIGSLLSPSSSTLLQPFSALHLTRTTDRNNTDSALHPKVKSARASWLTV